MTHRQITASQRYTLGVLWRQGLSNSAIARILGRHRSTVGRALHRHCTHHDGWDRPQLADWYACGHCSRSRGNRRLLPADWARVQSPLRADWSPEQIAGRLRLDGTLAISHETIYRYIWADKAAGGSLSTHLRGARKRRRKRYGSYDSRGRLAGKRPITARPAVVETRRHVRHREGDTMLGASQAGACVLSLVERKTGFVALGKLCRRATPEVNRRVRHLIGTQPRPVRTITVDKGTELHRYRTIERATSARFCFATPHHAWERGTNENTNGLLRQYLPKRHGMEHLAQHDCTRIATTLNRRSRKRLGYRTPEDCYVP